MSKLFKVESSHIEDLGSLQLTKLLKLLLHLEARSHGIAERAVEVGLKINVADGGEDGRIRWSGDPPSTNFLPSNFVQFQNKATEMYPADCAKELVRSDGSMKPMVESALDNDAAYILFITQELNKQQKEDRIALIRKKLADCRKDYAETAKIKIYDASKIEGWVNNFLPAIVAVLNWVGVPIERGLKTWEDWSRYPEYDQFPFVADHQRSNAITSLRDLLTNRRSCARIIGLSGLGKTRLAFEVFKSSNGAHDLDKRVVYLDAEAIPSAQGLISDWVQCDLEGIVVADNCKISLHDSLRKEIQRTDSKLSLLTLDYNIDQASQAETVHLKQLPDDKIKQMLEPDYGKKIHDLDRIVSFAQGFPQMAVLLAKARLDKDPEMGRLTDDEIARKMLWGSRDSSPKDEQILKGCSLFDHFGIDGESAKEYEFIAEHVVDISKDDFFDCLKRFEEKGLIDRRGRFGSFVPKPLAIMLAAEWWQRSRPKKHSDLINSDMPGNLVESFCKQVSFLDFCPEVKTFTAELCGSQGPFGQAEVILSERGSRLFRALVEVNPDATSNSLLNTLQNKNNEELLNIKGNVRRNLIRALERLCFHSSCFRDSAFSLLLLASAENESWSNNATGIFLQLFQTFLSGTEATPKMRLSVIDRALTNDQISARKLAIAALEQAINTHQGVRVVGAEHQGSGEPLEEWRPKVWGEAFEYWEQSLQRLCELIVEDDPLAPLAKNAIANNIRGLIQYGRIDILDTVLNEIVEHDGPLWPAALSSIKDSLRYDGKEMPAKGKNKLHEWEALLNPSDLGDRLNLFVTNPPNEHEQKQSGGYEDVAATNAKLLAGELASDMNSIFPYIESLLVGTQHKAYLFGKYLVEKAGAWEQLLSNVMVKVASIEQPSISFLLGILNGVFNIAPSKWEKIVQSFHDEKILRQFYAEAMTTGQVTVKQLNSLYELIVEKKIESEVAQRLAYGSPLDHLDYKDLVQFVKKLGSISNRSAWIAFDILALHCFGNTEKWENCKPAFKELIVTLKLGDVEAKQSRLDMYRWHDIVKKLLQSEDKDFAIIVTRRIIESCESRLGLGNIQHYIQPTIRILFKQYAKDIWSLFAEVIVNADPMKEYRLMRLLGNENSFSKREPSVLSDLPDELLEEWCLQNPEFAPEFIARTTDVFLDSDQKYIISSRAQFLIDKFGNNERVLSALSANMSSFSWVGSLVPYLQKEISVLKSFEDHDNKNVRNWVANQLSYLTEMIERETTRDEEHDWGIH